MIKNKCLKKDESETLIANKNGLKITSILSVTYKIINVQKSDLFLLTYIAITFLVTLSCLFV